MLIQLPLSNLMLSLLPIIVQTCCQSVVRLLQTLHFLRSVQDLLYFFRDVFRQPLKVDEVRVWVVLQEIIGQVNVTFWQENLAVKLYEHLDIIELVFGNFGFLQCLLGHIFLEKLLEHIVLFVLLIQLLVPASVDSV